MKAEDEQELRDRVADLVVAAVPDGPEVTLEDATADDFRTLIIAASVVSDEAGQSLHRWVDAGRHAGLSWAEIGEVLDVSRQAAQQRFARSTRSRDDAPQPNDSETITRNGMTAFNEVATLREEGEAGNELIGAAPLQLYFAPRGVRYKNIRVTALRPGPVIRRYEEAGWKHALTWYPFHYFTRPSPKSV